MADAYVEQLQTIVAMAAAKAVREVASAEDMALHRARALGLNADRFYADGFYYDEDWVQFVLFDDDDHGFDDAEVGFAP